jgi:hypothetical protein
LWTEFKPWLEQEREREREERERAKREKERERAHTSACVAVKKTSEEDDRCMTKSSWKIEKIEEGSAHRALNKTDNIVSDSRT